jgi:hypothetical protein
VIRILLPAFAEPFADGLIGHHHSRNLSSFSNLKSHINVRFSLGHTFKMVRPLFG